MFILMLTFFMAIHSNVIALLLLGLPFDRQLPWHKLLAVSTCFHSVIHFIAFYAGGRSDTMPTDAEADYHFSALWKKNAYGMEVSGAAHLVWSLLVSCQSTHSGCPRCMWPLQFCQDFLSTELLPMLVGRLSHATMDGLFRYLPTPRREKLQTSSEPDHA